MAAGFLLEGTPYPNDPATGSSREGVDAPDALPPEVDPA
jgi:hypothetical protein